MVGARVVGARVGGAGASARGRSALRRRLGAARGDRGMTAIEFVFLTPVLFFLIFATVQFAMYFFADHVAQAAAQAGARKARAEADAAPGTWRAQARTTAGEYIHQLGPHMLIGTKVHLLRPSAEQVGIRVTAQVPTVFPGLHLTVDARSQGPVERFVPDGH